MRLLLATLVLATIALPLATAHIIICTATETGCEVFIIGNPARPPHATIFEPPCFCIHSFDAPLLAERVLP